MTMAPKLASLRERSLPNPPPPPVTRAISPPIFFILYFLGMNDLIMPSNIAKVDNNRKPITSPINCKYVILALYTQISCALYLLRKVKLTAFARRVLCAASLRLRLSIVQSVISETQCVELF